MHSAPAKNKSNITTDQARDSIQLRESVRPIALVDRTLPTRDAIATDPIQSDSRESGDFTLERRWTKASLQHQLSRRKYAKYQQSRLLDSSVIYPDDNGDGSTSPHRQDYQPKNDQINTAIDILYENQRGAFTFGMPHFSSNSLSTFDPAPWTTSHHRPSAVNISNAQLPDLSWTWVWSTWYVDMCRDVDEQGWEYSLLFRGTAWHGNHPWFHSFVRRRRWIRKRVRVQDEATHDETALKARANTSATVHDRRGESLVQRLKAAMLDREKLGILRAYIYDPKTDLAELEEKVSDAHLLPRQLLMKYRCRRSYHCLSLATLADNCWTCSLAHWAISNMKMTAVSMTNQADKRRSRRNCR